MTSYFFLKISFAKEVHDLRKFGGPVLQPGFLLKGKISVLGIETNGEISLLPKEVCRVVSLMYTIDPVD